jgi:hypothetical protein
VTTRDLYRLGTSLAGTVLDFHQIRLAGAARLITIDVDATADPTHGQQQLAFFNAFYDTWCDLPLLATVAFNDERDQYLVAALLRPGTGAATRGVRGLLQRLVTELRARFRRTRLRVRLDAGFAHPKLLDWLDAEGLEYVIGVPSNARLAKRVRRLRGQARMLARATGETIPRYGDTRYAAKKWSHRPRIIMKAEALRYPGRPTKDNGRFVVTNLRFSPAMVSAIYCERGDMENRIKELKAGLAMDRTSCSRFVANQFRLLLSAAAFVLFQTVQTYAHGTALANAQVATLRDRLLKVAVWIEPSARRILLHLPQHFPWLAPWRHLAAAIGAT